MNTVTYGGARAPRTAVSQRAKAKKRKRFFARFKDALMESRRQQARRTIEDHAYLLPNDPDSPVQGERRDNETLSDRAGHTECRQSKP
jgi:hypothetical protein